MTTSGAYSSGYQIDDLLAESWERLGKTASILTAEVAVSARRSLNLMLIDWTNRGVPLWQVEQITSYLTIGEPLYVLPLYVVDLLDTYITDMNGSDRLLGRISRSDYAAIAEKTLQDIPSQVWVDRQADGVQLTFYPVPSNAYLLTANTLRVPQDCTNLFQTADAPLLWGEALAAGLAARLAEKYAPDRFMEKVTLAEKAWTSASGEERDRVPFIITPAWGIQ